MDVGFLVYGCISDDAGSHRATSAGACGHVAAAHTGPTQAPARNTSKRKRLHPYKFGYIY